MADVSSKDVYDWIKGHVAKKNPKTGKAVCPFAARTIKERSLYVLPAKVDVVDQIGHCCGLFAPFHFDIVILYIRYKITEKRLSDLCRQAHQNNPNFAILYDHPSNKGLHKGVQFSFQKAPLIMIQDLSKLKDAQQQLRTTGYYDAWGLDDLDMFY